MFLARRFTPARPTPWRRRPPKSGLVRPHLNSLSLGVRRAGAEEWLAAILRNFPLADPADLRILLVPETRQRALVAELVDAYDSGSYGVTCGGSSPLESTIFTPKRQQPAPSQPGPFAQEIGTTQRQALKTRSIAPACRPLDLRMERAFSPRDTGDAVTWGAARALPQAGMARAVGPVSCLLTADRRSPTADRRPPTAAFNRGTETHWPP